MFKKLLIFSLNCLSGSALAATATQQPAVNPHEVRAYTRHLAKCQLLYNNCMKRNCKGTPIAKCNMANHCHVEYQKYCVSEAAAIKPSNLQSSQSRQIQAQQKLYHAQQACSQLLRQACNQQKANKQCTPNAAYNECMRAAQRSTQ